MSDDDVVDIVPGDLKRKANGDDTLLSVKRINRFASASGEATAAMSPMQMKQLWERCERDCDKKATPIGCWRHPNKPNNKGYIQIALSNDKKGVHSSACVCFCCRRASNWQKHASFAPFCHNPFCCNPLSSARGVLLWTTSCAPTVPLQHSMCNCSIVHDLCPHQAQVPSEPGQQVKSFVCVVELSCGLSIFKRFSLFSYPFSILLWCLSKCFHIAQDPKLGSLGVSRYNLTMLPLFLRESNCVSFFFVKTTTYLPLNVLLRASQTCYCLKLPLD